MTMVSTSTTALNDVEGKINIEVQIDGNKWYVKFSDETTFGAESEKLTAEGYLEILERPNDKGPVMANVYSKDENGKWMMSQEESVWGMDYSDIVDEYVEMYDFENFTYNALLRQYEAKDLEFDYGKAWEEEFGKEFYGELIYTFELFTFRFENGKLICREEQGKVEADGFVGSYVGDVTYSYGTASVTLPVVGE